ncbi:hypothetical protein [Nocardiopsis alba]|uniref:hypothetical protein n=1 Tax=Nocardiopsis alba TaxID=53437 RepID=UPI0033CD16DA
MTLYHVDEDRLIGGGRERRRYLEALILLLFYIRGGESQGAAREGPPALAFLERQPSDLLFDGEGRGMVEQR